jgi:hypothetical protein
VAWGGRLFVFKQTKFFVFYSTSTDAAGQPIFNYNAEVGRGAVSSFDGYGAVAAPDGVYFLARDGLFRTTGGTPERVSQAVDPYLRADALAFFSGPSLSGLQATAMLSTYGGHVVLGIASVGLLRFTPSTGAWTYFDIPAQFSGVPYFNSTYNRDDLVFPATVGGVSRIFRLSPAYTDDNGTAISSYYRSGLYDLGTPNDKVIHRSEVHGTGTVGFSIGTNREAMPTARTIALGTAPTPARGYDNWAPKPGQYMSHKFSSVSGAPWQVDSLTEYMRPSRAPALRAA